MSESTCKGNSNPSPENRFKPGNKMAQRKRGMKYKVRNEIVNFIKEIPVGQKPWERLYQIGNAENVGVDLHYKANKTLGDWGLNEEPDNAVSITAELVNVDNIDNLIFKRLGIAQDEQEDSEGEATNEAEEKILPS